MLGTTPTPPNRKINKTARSTVDLVNWQHSAEGLALLRGLRDSGAYLLAVELTDTSHNVFTAELPVDVSSGSRRMWLIPGTETSGVPAEVLELCHAAVHLPMRGRNSSLNVAVALGAVAYVIDSRLST